MNVSLTPELEDLVRDKVKSGRYGSATEVVGEALRLMIQRDRFQELHKEQIREKIAAGVASLRAGQGADGEDFFDRVDAELDAIQRLGPA